MNDNMKQLASKIEKSGTGVTRESYFPYALYVDLPNDYSVYVEDDREGREYDAVLYASLEDPWNSLDSAHFKSENELLAKIQEWAQREPIKFGDGGAPKAGRKARVFRARKVDKV